MIASVTLKLEPNRKNIDGNKESIWGEREEFKLRKRFYDALFYMERKRRKAWGFNVELYPEIAPYSVLDDSDMNRNYYLFVAYIANKQKNVLATARFYSDRECVLSELKGETGIYYPHPQNKKDIIKIDANKLINEDENYCVIDRFCNIERDNPMLTSNIVLELVKSITETIQAKKIYAIARQERSEKLLVSYTSIGMTIVGQNKFKIGGVGEPFIFWVLEGELDKIQERLKCLSNARQ